MNTVKLVSSVHKGLRYTSTNKSTSLIKLLGILYYFIQFVCHTSHPISENPCNNFFLILADFGDLSEKLKVTCIYELNEIVQYAKEKNYPVSWSFKMSMSSGGSGKINNRSIVFP